ncbi:vitellogenin-like [Anoplophora glabripennis]|uniref:vitellogenin-like n=1 Tax=Anoplophora glabripennis TaxID=217634 RepID=UPI0008750453|nr:vitellogenin-like [Anoplophora glabripennis]
MWSHIVICLLVGYASASTNPGWKENSEYVYKIRGRTLASLHEVANQYSGIIFKSDLKIQPRSDGKLQGQISNAQYSQVHSHLEDGWNSEIRDADVSYKPLPASSHPFQIEMKDGVIRDLIVNKDIPNWEANVIKSVASQFQLNTNAIDHLPSTLTALPEDDQNSAVFKTMEDTVTGKTETMYDIHPMPEYVLQSKPWLARHLELKGEGEVIEVVKHKNYSNHDELPLYHYGFGDSKDYKPGTNYMGYFFIRNSISRGILTGSLKRYTVQNVYTVNEIVMSPNLNNKQKGSVISMVNVTLEEINSNGQDLGEVPSPIPLGNLVYTYVNPKTGGVSRKRPHEGNSDSDESRYQRSATMKRIRRAIGDYDDSRNSYSSHSSKSSSSSSEEDHYQRSQPQLREAPHAPLLPYSTGYKGMSIKHDPNVDIKKSVHKIAQDIGSDMQNPEQFLRQNTLNKFTTMTALIRLMDQQELKQVAIDLYSQNKNGPQRDTWTAFRDAVAECGTGPAFLTIQDWIQSGKVKEEEAAEIVTTMTAAVREPTRDYLKSWFDFIKKPKVQSQENLYYSALLSYSNLIREVCVDRKEAKAQYPEKSFGKFCTDEARQDVEKSVIPYFTKQLHEAVSQADTYKIHAYIRALGNVGHPEILAAFEPYLEGKKQASQFQRLLMVMAMDKLTETYPKVARSVLYKIYQNTGESQKVRAACVYQLMHANPPADMLQRMAAYTNIDTQEHVNAAVKSSIEYASELEDKEYYWLRSSAEAAKPLLTKKQYGVQHGQVYFRSYITEELKSKYHQSCQYLGSEEEFYPTGLRSRIHDNLGGQKRKLATFDAMVSSIDEMIHVVKHQTSDYQQQRQEQQQKAQQQGQHKFSSLYIAQLLNMKADEREQFEGNLYTELQGAFYKFWPFDNRSMEKLPEEIRKYEEEIRNKKEYHYTKITNREMALSFPTETGLPFLFTYDIPRAVKVEGYIQGEASPQISDGGKLQKPDTMNLKVQLGFTVNTKIQGRLSFTTPFDGQQYICGFDRNIQVHIPLQSNFKVDVKNGQIEAEIENKEIHEGAALFHYSTWPYTSRVDVKNFQPVSAQQNTHYIRQQNLRSFDQVYGKKKTGIAVRVQIEHEREFIDIQKLHDLMHGHNAATTLWRLLQEASIHYGQINVLLQPEQSSAQKYIVRAGYQYKYITENEHRNAVQSPNWHQLFSMPTPLARQENLIDTIGAGIKSADVYVWDADIEFQGSKNIKYSVMGGVGRSNVHPKSRAMFYYKKTSDDQDEKSYEASLEAESEIPNTNGLDLSESLRTEPKADTTMQVKFGESLKSATKAEFKFEWRRSEERKQYLKEQTMYKECQREMNEGNYQLPACANMTMTSNLLDRVKIDVQYENMKQEVSDAVKSIYEVLKLYHYPTLEVDRQHGTGQQNQIQFEARFDPDLRAVNISVKAKDHHSTINTIEVDSWAQKVFVVHPVFHLPSRMFGHGLGLHTYRPICVVDKTYVSTFNNKTYPVPLGNYWTLLLQHVPKEARHGDQQLSVEEQLMYEPEHYAILARQHQGSDQHKEIKITLSSPETEYKVIDITLSPASQRDSRAAKANVKVDDQQVQVNDEQSYDVKKGYIQIYALPNGEVKVEVENAFYAIYDGYRVKLTVVNGKFRDSVRGLCGAFNDDPASDFMTSENCIARDYQEFVKSFELEGSEGEQQRKQFAGRTEQCVPKEVPLYVNVISEKDAGHGKHSGDSGRSSKGTRFQTRYVENGGEVCFTIRPVPVCNSRSQQRGAVRKSVPVHCVQKSNVAQLWINQINRGASPDFSHKKESKTVQIELPQSCSQ